MEEFAILPSVGAQMVIPFAPGLVFFSVFQICFHAPNIQSARFKVNIRSKESVVLEIYLYVLADFALFCKYESDCCPGFVQRMHVVAAGGGGHGSRR